MFEQENIRKFFSDKSKVKLIIAAVAVMGLLMFVSSGVQNSAWSQGYQAGQAATMSRAGEVSGFSESNGRASESGFAASRGGAREMSVRGHGRGMGHERGFFGGLIGGLFRLGFFLVMLVVFAKLFKRIMWHFSSEESRAKFSQRWAKHGPGGRHFAEKFGADAPWRRNRQEAAASETDESDPDEPTRQFYV